MRNLWSIRAKVAVKSLYARSLLSQSSKPTLKYRFTVPQRNHDPEIVQRLMAAYQAALENQKVAKFPTPGVDLWDHILSNDLLQFRDALAAGDLQFIQSFMPNIGRDYTWFGGLSLGIDGYTPVEFRQSEIALLYWEKMVALAESQGVLNCENPESGPYLKNIHVNPRDLILKMQSELGIDIAPPDDILPTFGFIADERVYHYRHINSLYAAAQCRHYLKPGASVIEIGAGLGLSCLYARRFQPLDYSIYDLPLTCFISGFFLMNALGKDQVCLFGETPNRDAVKILPYWSIADLADGAVDLALNQDGLPEIDDITVQFLLRNIERCVNDKFYSFNHEVFGLRRVSTFVAQHTGFKRLSRGRNWVREGYVDELYAKDWQ
ncbi:MULTISPECIES: putative sugar O-methyltransferase [unclassified Bradyrhizobium]|uniref:putative sugar O-methyltransferase n=1 Tax=unclassified Bradyrhizobium TaxID=2631580 RepID=UPI001FF8896B|nr:MULTISPECIES: putative sugar O-methyltransferase [unclassified Bradyrhizobium]MCK1534625.1 putative sugar O-methyltransferase [Bradyrhizobium sp. 176]MCK1557862.1 putative sugar O-methyltransferase [Bradyrhizobium sp. 171]UPJ98287.1 putative sugar O-methyltransferase [Bradyrhizobium sp. 172]